MAQGQPVFLRVSVFFVWLVTLLVVIGIFLAKMVAASMVFADLAPQLSKVVAIVVPQLSLMLTFFFSLPEGRIEQIVRANPDLAALVAILSLVYHTVFIAVLIVGIWFEAFGPTIVENSDAVVQVMGYLSVIGVAPVTYLFSTKGPAAKANFRRKKGHNQLDIDSVGHGPLKND